MTRYTIVHNGQIIHDSYSDSPDLRVDSPEYSYTMGEAGVLKFTLKQSHPAYNSIAKFSSEISLFIDDEWEFSGRVLDDKTSFFNAKNIEVEGDLTYLNDSIVRPYNWDSGSISGYLDFFIDNHNSQVEPRKRFVRGQVTVTNSTDNLVRGSSSYPSSWAEMKDKLTGNSNLGGYLRTRRYQGQTYLDYLEDYQSVNSQVIRFGENILDMSRYVKGEDICTAVIPLGSTIEGEETETGGEVRLTIEDVNDGLDYVYDEEAVSLYGWVFHTETWDDINHANILKQRAEQYLNQQRLLGITLEVKAVDLSLVEVDAERIRVGDLIRVVSPPHGVDEFLTVESMKLDLVNPDQTEITLGVERKELTDEITRDIRNVTRSILVNYVTNDRLVDRLDSAITTVRTELESEITQTAEGIELRVAETYATKSALESETVERQSQISQTVEDVNIRFDEVNTSVEEVDGKAQQSRDELTTNFNFSNRGMRIGQSNSQYTMEVDNSRLRFLRDGAQVAHFDGNKLVVPSGDFSGDIKAETMNLAGELRVGGNGEGGIVPDGDRTRFVGRTPTTSGPTDTVAYGRTDSFDWSPGDNPLVMTLTYESPVPTGARIPIAQVHLPANRLSGSYSPIVWNTAQRTASGFSIKIQHLGGWDITIRNWVYYMSYWGEPPNSNIETG